MSSRTGSAPEASSGHAGHASDQVELKLLAFFTYGLFLLAAIGGRLLRGRFNNRGYRESRSVWREAWETACSTLAFAFNHG